ncbi:hypothetical protein BDN67DRAFT_913803, partial [Paxillus ammoniavirescens]
VLYRTCHSGFIVNISSSHMTFSRPPGSPLFMASINDNNTAFLDGCTEPISKFMQPATMVPLDFSLWHCRLAHYHVAGVKALVEHDMTGLKLKVKTLPDPVCEPCLAGKMHARLLRLVHTDVHQLPYRTFTGYHYWATFINDY